MSIVIRRAILLGLLVLTLQAAGARGSEPPQPVLAYASDLAGNLDVHVVRLGGQATPRRLTSSPRDDFSPSWSPDGRRIAYRVNPRRSDVGDIWVMHADGTRKRNLTRTPGHAEWSPSWSPNGRSIAYYSASPSGGDVWIMGADGRGKRNLTRNGLLNEYPTWSRDGRRIAFNSHRDGQFEIYTIRTDGRDARNITRNPGQDEWPAWSPDGMFVAFMSDRDGSEDVFVMRPNGSGVRNLTRTPDLDESHPAWMPDGRLSFIRYGETGPIALWATSLATGEAEQLSTDAEPIFVFAWKPR